MGINAFAFARGFQPFLEKQATRRLHHLGRVLLLALGLMLFGVTITQHMLHHAGSAAGTSICGSLLNVPFRIFCGALTLHLVVNALPLEGYLAALT